MPIFFCGDITIDNYEFYGEFESKFRFALGASAIPQKSSSHGPDKVIVRQFGGTYLLARFTGIAWSLWYGENNLKKPLMAELRPWRKFHDRYLKPHQVSLFQQPRRYDCNWQLSYRLQKFKDDRFRVAPHAYEGFTLPLAYDVPKFVRSKTIELYTGSEKVLFVVNVVSDRGENPQLATDLAAEIANERHCWVVMKIIDPPHLDKDRSPLMAALLESKGIKQVVGVVPADELRKSGVSISRSLSWDHTLRDVIDHVQCDELLPGNTPPHLVITFDYDAALYLKTKAVNGTKNKREIEAGDLIFSVEGAEEEFANTIEGTMPGAQSVFVSALSALLHQQVEQAGTSGAHGMDSLPSIQHLLACALIAKRRFLQSGFANTGWRLPFEFEWTRIGKARRRMPRLDYSEGIFSHLEEASQVSAKAPDPYILDERKIDQRVFHNPSEVRHVSATMQKQKIAHYSILKDQLPNEHFSIFDQVAGKKPLSDFRNYVLTETAPEEVPICKFGKIKTAHVQEIEQLRTIGKLVQSYLSHPSGSSKPLGIAVFGPPGAGKSTAVKGIVENLPKACKKLVQDAFHECNLAALVDPEDLAHYFQLARDAALRGNVPILFFDEFDCAVGGSKYFWLKHFLAPLQDGEFRSSHTVYPIGRAIFVFAGGVSDAFVKFAEAMEENRMAAHSSSVDLSSEATAGSTAADQVNFKGVDFLSRLHGHIDVYGLSPKKEEKAFYHSSDKGCSVVVDRSYLMRRAFILRSLLQLHAPRIFSEGSPQEAQIDCRIVDALLLTKKFAHGTRSMEAIIRMSSLEGKDRFELSHLPPDSQLAMHVDSDNLGKCLDGAQTIWEEFVNSGQVPADDLGEPVRTSRE